MPIHETVERLRLEIPGAVEILAAVKGRTDEERRTALAAGIRCLGDNYVQEAQAAQTSIGRNEASWHLIGHLQRNKVNAAVRLFDLIQTVDSARLAERIDEACRRIGRVMPVLIEVNTGREPQKAGVFPEETLELARRIVELPSLRLRGLMTMGPAVSDPEQLRPAFAEARRLFERLATLDLPTAEISTLSMGMSDSYRVAVEEGSTMVRLGTVLFGPRGERG
jgi:pyridoxal phosphate enzyme (YggS family)